MLEPDIPRDVLGGREPHQVTATSLRKALIHEASAHGWKPHYDRDRGGRVKSGFPDLVLVRGKTMVCVHVLQDTGLPTHAQRDWQEALKDIPSVVCCIVTPSGAQQFCDTILA